MQSGKYQYYHFVLKRCSGALIAKLSPLINYVSNIKPAEGLFEDEQNLWN
jgi:hypothetical protein